MTKEELEQFEQRLKERGYKRTQHELGSNEAYGWSKSWYVDNTDTIKYFVIFRVWDYIQFYAINPFVESSPYCIDVLIVDRNGYRLTSPNYNIDTTEDLASNFHDMLNLAHQKRVKV